MTSRVEDLDRHPSDSEIIDQYMERPREVRPWSVDEVALLRTGLTSRDIATSIGRTTGAVNAKRFRLTHGVRDRSHEQIDRVECGPMMTIVLLWTLISILKSYREFLEDRGVRSISGVIVFALATRRHRITSACGVSIVWIDTNIHLRA